MVKLHQAWQRRVTRVLALFVALILFMTIIFSALWLNNLGIFNIDDNQLNAILHHEPADNSIVFDRNGKEIGEFYSHYQIYVPYNEIPRPMVEAVLAIEDRQFFEHSGIDVRAIARAIAVRIGGKKTQQGASTITQQVVRHFLLTNERTVERKIKEAALSLRLETLLSKEKILEIYLNEMFLGNGTYGVGAAARRFFGKDLRDLDMQEFALIAGLFQSPSRYNPAKYPNQARKRQKLVLKAMADNKSISARDYKLFIKKPLVYQFTSSVNTQLAPYFIDYIAEETKNLMQDGMIKNQGLRIYTTLDSSIQDAANKAVAENEGSLQRLEAQLPKTKENKVYPAEVALLVTHPRTGEILAMVGGRNYHQSQFNRTWQSQRQPGSLFKPVVYSLALQRGFNWSDMYYVAPIAIDNYRPKNFSDSFLTETTMYRAFYMSMNTPTVELGSRLGVNEIMQHAKKLGVRTPLKKETGTILGASDVTMMDIARMYGIFASEGNSTPLVAITKIMDRQGNVLFGQKDLNDRQSQVLSPQVNYLMLSGLQAVLRHGTAAKAGEFADIAAGKTGTTNESRDNWFCGFTTNLLAVAWVGTDHPAGLGAQSTGTSLALPLWMGLMQRLPQVKEAKPFAQPEGVVLAKVHPRFGYLDPDGVSMPFMLGQEPATYSSTLKIVNDVGNYRGIFD